MLLTAKSISDLEIFLMQDLFLSLVVQDSPKQGLQCLITTIFLPLGAV